jgi:mRNA-degrading endonuclease RelE of RelBE toxin-antitoxin system
MPWRVEISRQGERDLDRLPDRDEIAVGEMLRRLADDPSAVDMRKLAGSLNTWRLRVGRWRVLLVANNRTGTMLVDRVLDRRDAYRG